MSSDASYGSLAFREQESFFRRKLNVPTEAWTDVYANGHDTAFMVAGANRDDLVADFRGAVDRIIADGATLEDFRRDFDQIVAKHGWDYKGGRAWRTRTIYETNLFSSYSAGRYEQLMAVRETRPYWMYMHSDAVQNPRPHHLKWHGLILRWDDPWWQTHFPINAWGCQCYVVALSEADLRRMGKTGPDQAPPMEWEDRLIGQRSPGGPHVVRVPAGIDPGFEYAPGASLQGAHGPLVQSGLEKTLRLPAGPAAHSAAQLLGLPSAREALNNQVQDFVHGVMADGQARNRWTMVGALSESVVDGLEARGVPAATAAIVLRDQEVLHALRASKQARTTRAGLPVGLTPDEFARLPDILAAPAAVLLDVGAGTLIYAFRPLRREAGWLAVQVNYRLKTAAGKVVVNSVRSASLGEVADLRSGIGSGKLVLLEGEL